MISIAYDVKRYRELLEEKIKNDDVVIEIGPHQGKSATNYSKRVRVGILVDKSDQAKISLKSLLKKRPKIKFIQGDVRKFATIKKVMKLTKKCDLLALDMGGGRFPDTVFKVWAVWSGVFKPRDSIIRNRGLAEFVQRAKIKDDKIMKKFKDSGWLAEWGRAMPYELKRQLGEFKFWIKIKK